MPSDEGEAAVDLWLMKEDGSDPRQLTAERGSEATPDWSPDGARIAFAGTRASDNFDAYAINVDGTGLRRLTDTAADEGYPTWSPDRPELLYTAIDLGEDTGELRARP